MKEFDKRPEDDSFNSYTELQLDRLYKNSRKATKRLVKIKKRMTFLQEPEEFKTLLKAQDTKIEDLRRHTM